MAAALNMIRKYRKLILVVLCAVFVTSFSLLVVQLVDYSASRKAVDEAKELAGIPEFDFDYNEYDDEDEDPDEFEETEPESDESGEAQSGTAGIVIPSLSTENTQEAEKEISTEEKTTAAETEPPKSVEEQLSSINLKALQEVNKDVIGWIAVPGTPISYPLMRSKDNKEYLKKAWNGKHNLSGSIFLERLCSPDMTDQHTLIYGHNMLNTSFFSPLVKYKKKKFRNSNPYVYIVTEDKIYKYEIFSSYEADVNSITYQYEFSNSEKKEKFIDHIVSSSDWKATERPDTDDLILTLSTCTNAGSSKVRRVVHAVLIETTDR